MSDRLKMWRLAARRRIRRSLGLHDDAYPAAPSGTRLSPSEIHFADYDSAPLRLARSRATTGDPLSWQAETRAKLAELLGYQVSGIPAVGRHVSRHRIDGSLTRVSLYLRVRDVLDVPINIITPTSPPARRLPVMICLQGTNSGAHLSWGEVRLPADVQKVADGYDFALQAASRGYIAVCVELSCFGERTERQLKPTSAAPCIDAANHALLLGRCLLGERASDVHAVVSWIRSAADELGADAEAIFCLGHSAGGSVALFSAALDTRIAGVIASGCVGFIRKTIARRRDDQGQNVVPGILQWMELDDVVALCAPRFVLAVSGEADHIWPFRGLQAVVDSAGKTFAALGAAEKLICRSAPGGHRFYPELVWPALEQHLIPRARRALA